MMIGLPRVSFVLASNHWSINFCREFLTAKCAFSWNKSSLGAEMAPEIVPFF